MAGRPANITYIVPPNTILTVQAMSVEELGPLQLGLMLQGNTKLQVEWLARRRLLRNTHQCIRCGIACTLVAQRDVADGFRWKCRLCGEKRNIRLHSFFKSNLPLRKLVWLLFSWATEIAMQDVTWHLNISKHTVIDWYNFVRDVCAIDVRNNPQPLGGFDNNGSPIVVEIDESYFYLRKYHRGRVNVGEWVFGAVERESGLCRMQVVPDRRAVTIQPIIQQWLLPGTHIMSDGWPAYHNLDQLNGGVYIHDVVIHEQNFVDPLHPEIHTQNVENMWMRAKRKLRRQFGTARPLFITYLEEFLWMQQHRNRQRRLSSLLVCIRDQYP